VNLVTDFAILIFGSAVPAGVALFLLRGALMRPHGAWTAIMFGMMALTGFAMAVIWAVYAYAEQEMARCNAAKGLDCEDSLLVVVMVGMPVVVSVLVFLVAATLIRVWRSRRKTNA